MRGASSTLAQSRCEIGDADTTAAVLVFVGRADPPPRRADLLAFLARRVKQLVVR